MKQRQALLDGPRGNEFKKSSQFVMGEQRVKYTVVLWSNALCSLSP